MQDFGNNKKNKGNHDAKNIPDFSNYIMHNKPEISNVSLFSLNLKTPYLADFPCNQKAILILKE